MGSKDGINTAKNKVSSNFVYPPDEDFVRFKITKREVKDVKTGMKRLMDFLKLCK